MRTSSRKFFRISLTFLVAATVAGSGAVAANLTVYPDEASLLAAIGQATTHENFDGFPVGTIITTQVPGVVISSPNSPLPGFVPIQVVNYPAAASSPPRVLRGGNVPTNPSILQVFTLDFSPTIKAFGFYLAGQDPAATDASVRFEFSDQTVQTLFVGDTDGNALTPEFFGATSDTPIESIRIVSGTQLNGNFQDIGIDDLIVGAVDTTPPVCSGIPGIIGDFPQVSGAATDSGPFDSGIASVALDPASTNLQLTVDPFAPGDPSATFTVQLADTNLDGSGQVLVTDLAGLTCDLPVDLLFLPPGPLDGQQLCFGSGILFQVSSDALTPAGGAACNIDGPTAPEPPLPPGYEPLPPGEPTPCRTATIDSVITGTVQMVYKIDGAFDPRLRLLFSLFDGTGFTPFVDVTETVEPITTIVPDPTKIGGTATWLVPPAIAPVLPNGPTVGPTESFVKVTCALQAELCNGLDDDGDGSIDEGLPVGLPLVDFDLDTYPLCEAPGSNPADCNDQIAAINPGATEVCNGLDDNCDGVIDENSPQIGAGIPCSIPGIAGACGAGLTSCSNGPLVCEQVEFSPTAPIVTILDPNQVPPDPPQPTPFSVGVDITDPDGLTGHIVHEVVTLEGCPIWDGDTYGNMDGLLTDETLPVIPGTLCNALTACGVSVITNPLLTVTATDCGGNTGSDEALMIGEFFIVPAMCTTPPSPGSAAGSVGDSLRLAVLDGMSLRMTWGGAANAETFNVYEADNPRMNGASLAMNTDSLVVDMAGELTLPVTRFYLVKGVSAGGIEGP